MYLVSTQLVLGHEAMIHQVKMANFQDPGF